MKYIERLEECLEKYKAIVKVVSDNKIELISVDNQLGEIESSLVKQANEEKNEEGKLVYKNEKLRETFVKDQLRRMPVNLKHTELKQIIIKNESTLNALAVEIRSLRTIIDYHASMGTI